MIKRKAHMAVTAGLALGILATFAAATPAIAETTDTATPTTISATNTGDILTPDANGDVTYTNDNGATTKVSIVVSGNGSKDENTGDFTVPVLTYDKSNDDVTFKANFNPNQGGMAMTGYTKIDDAAGNYETNSWEDDYSDSLPYTVDENGVTHINVHDTFNISTQDIDGNEEKYGGVAATWMKSWAAYDNFKLQVNKGNGEYASNDPAVVFTPTAEDMGNGFTIPKASLPTKEGYHIKAFRTDKYDQDVPVNFTTDGNAVLSLAELTHTRIMADGATRYSRADIWFNAITPIFEADETEPTPTPTPTPTVTPTVSTTSRPRYNTDASSYPTGECTWGAKTLAPWAGDYWGNGAQWATSAAAAGFRTGSTPQVGAIACWNDGAYGHVAVVTAVESNTRIQVSESNYGKKRYIGNHRGWFNPTTTSEGFVTYIYQN